MFALFRGGRRGRPNPIQLWFWRMIAMDSQRQILVIVISAILMGALVFSGVLLFRQSDNGDLMNRGLWYAKQGKMVLAAKSFEKLLQHDRGNYRAYLELGKAYLELEKPELAAKQFRMASRLRAGNLKDSGAHVAVSRLLIIQGQFPDAEKQLLQALKVQKKETIDKELALALIDLYSDWGDSFIDQDPPQLLEAFNTYYKGFPFVQTKLQQDDLANKFKDAGQLLSDQLENQGNYEKAAKVLRILAKYVPTQDNYLSVSAIYQKQENLDEAIFWARKAYELEPKSVSLRLANMLVEKGQEFNNAHRPQQAKLLFDEAQQINADLKLPLAQIYPLELKQPKFQYKLSPDRASFIPVFNFSVVNAGANPMPYLAVQVRFSSEESILSEAQFNLAKPGKPLMPIGKPKSEQRISVKPEAGVLLSEIPSGKLHIGIYVKYQASEQAEWAPLKSIEVSIPEASRRQKTKSP